MMRWLLIAFLSLVAGCKEAASNPGPTGGAVGGGGGGVPAAGDMRDWPTFRGGDHSGVSRETGLLRAWPKAGPPLAWKAEDLGEGYGSVAVVGNRVYVIGHRGGEEVISVLDAASGDRAWSRKIGPAARVDRPGARSTPTIDGDRLYALSVGGDLVSMSLDGKTEHWRKNLAKDFKGRRGGWGYAESPLIDGDLLVCTPGGKDATLVALDKLTGGTRWKGPVPQGDGAAYATVVPAEFQGERMYLQFLQRGVVGVAARDGKFLWRYDRCANGTANCSSPVYRDGLVFTASGYGTGGGLVRLASENGGVTATEVRFTKDMKNQHGGMVLLGDHLYGSCDPDFLTCLDFKTGQTAWKDRKPGKGCITAADGHLYYRNQGNGDVMLVEVNPSGYKEKGRFRVTRHGGQGAWAYPVVCQGKLFIRDWHTLYCFDIKQK